MRKQEYITKLNYRDERFAYVTKSCQHISQNQALELVSRHRLNNYIKQGLVRKLHYIHNNRQHTAFELTNKGRGWVRKNFPQLGDRFYSSGTAIRHNIRLAEQIMEHYQLHGRTWLNERDMRELLMEKVERCPDSEERFRILGQLERGELSLPDGGYYDNGELVAVEVINDNYTAEMIAAKELCAQTMGASLHFVRQ